MAQNKKNGVKTEMKIRMDGHLFKTVEKKFGITETIEIMESALLKVLKNEKFFELLKGVEGIRKRKSTKGKR